MKTFGNLNKRAKIILAIVGVIVIVAIAVGVSMTLVPVETLLGSAVLTGGPNIILGQSITLSVNDTQCAWNSSNLSMISLSGFTYGTSASTAIATGNKVGQKIVVTADCTANTISKVMNVVAPTATPVGANTPTPAATPQYDAKFNPAPNGAVRALAAQSDNKVIVGGEFTMLGGQRRNHIGRLNADGAIDTTFNPNIDGNVYALKVQSDGKILVGGSFSTAGGQARTNLARLNSDGSVDATFAPNPDRKVLALALQSDGKIWVGGSFFQIAGYQNWRIARLESNGNFDMTWPPPSNVSGDVTAIAMQPDGKVVFAADIPIRGIYRRLNRVFDRQGFFYDGSTDGVVYALLYSNRYGTDLIYIGGAFSQMSGTTDEYADPNRIFTSGPGFAALRMASGKLSLDTSSIQLDAGAIVYALAERTDGIWMGGNFTDQVAANKIYRNLERRGFTNGGGTTDGPVYALAVLPNGKLIVGGAFTTLNGASRANIGAIP